jgi:serine/threonine-protein kinase
MNPDERRAETLLPGSQAPEPAKDFTPSPADSAAEISLPLDLGTILVTEVLARGGMGITFLGTAVKDSNRRVVVKIPLTPETHLLDRFKNEVRILSQLDHPNIVRFVDAGESDIPFNKDTRKLPWLAMEYVSGASLRAMLKKQPKAEWKDVHLLLENVLRALDHLHSKNLCHRDIKPDNLIYDPQASTWKLVDFGIAKELIDNLRLTMTMVESNPGAWDYMSPEQSRGQHLDIRSDIYSLGLTAWEALIGVVPRPGASFPSAMLGPDSVPPDVDKLIARMTAHRAEDRYQSPSEALAALQEGAGVIEKKEKGRKQRSKLLRCLVATTGTAALIALTWIAGHSRPVIVW